MIRINGTKECYGVLKKLYLNICKNDHYPHSFIQILFYSFKSVNGPLLYFNPKEIIFLIDNRFCKCDYCNQNYNLWLIKNVCALLYMYLLSYKHIQPPAQLVEDLKYIIENIDDKTFFKNLLMIELSTFDKLCTSVRNNKKYMEFLKSNIFFDNLLCHTQFYCKFLMKEY